MQHTVTLTANCMTCDEEKLALISALLMEYLDDDDASCDAIADALLLLDELKGHE